MQEKKTLTVSGTLPVRPHLANFLNIKENLSPDRPLLVPGNSCSGMFLDNLLTNAAAIRDRPGRDSLPSDYTGSIHFEIQSSRVTWGDIHLSDSRLIAWNSYLHKLMHETLFSQILTNLRLGIQEKRTIHLFMEHYQLYDLNAESIKRASTRWRTTNGHPLVPKNLSPQVRKTAVFA